MGIRTSATLDTPDRLIQGAGVLYFNFKSFADRGVSVGATRGGVQVNLNNTLRDIEADNLQGATKGLVLKDKGNPELTFTILEMDKARLKECIAGARVSGNTITGENVKLADYLENVTWIGYTPDGTQILMYQLFNVLPLESSMSATDNNESELSVTFRGHYAEGMPFTDVDGFPMQPIRITLGEPFLDVSDTTTIAGLSSDTSKYLDIALAPNGKLYCAPRDATNVLIIDPATNTADTTTITGITGTSKYRGIALAPNGKLYCAPYDVTNVLIIDPATNTADTTTIAGLTSTLKYQGIALAPNGKLYCAPRDATNVLIIDPATNTADTTTIAGLSSDTDKYLGIALAPNGKLYCAPFNATNVLIIDPATNTADTTTITGITGTSKYLGIALAPNGKLYCAPFNATNVLIID